MQRPPSTTFSCPFGLKEHNVEQEVVVMPLMPRIMDIPSSLLSAHVHTRVNP